MISFANDEAMNDLSGLVEKNPVKAVLWRRFGSESMTPKAIPLAPVSNMLKYENAVLRVQGPSAAEI